MIEPDKDAAHHLWRDAHKLQVKSGDEEMLHKLKQGQPIEFSDANRLRDAIRAMLRAKKERRLEIEIVRSHRDYYK